MGAKMFGIERLLDRKPSELRGRAAAGALARRWCGSQCFLLDEPLSNPGCEAENLAREELQQFQRSVGITTIYVTHDQVEAMGWETASWSCTKAP